MWNGLWILVSIFYRGKWTNTQKPRRNFPIPSHTAPLKSVPRWAITVGYSMSTVLEKCHYGYKCWCKQQLWLSHYFSLGRYWSLHLQMLCWQHNQCSFWNGTFQWPVTILGKRKWSSLGLATQWWQISIIFPLEQAKHLVYGRQKRKIHNSWFLSRFSYCNTFFFRRFIIGWENVSPLSGPAVAACC